MPPRNEEELDPVTLHNQALMNIEEDATNGFKKIELFAEQSTISTRDFPKSHFVVLQILTLRFGGRCFSRERGSDL